MSLALFSRNFKLQCTDCCPVDWLIETVGRFCWRSFPDFGVGCFSEPHYMEL